MAVGAVWARQSHRRFQQICEQSLLDKRDELARRRIDDELAIAQEQRSERDAERASDDAIARSERRKWTRVIEMSTAAMRKDATRSRPKPVVRLAGYS